MNRDILVDAMEWIDDDLLCGVDALRKRKPSPRPMLRAAALAACLCVMISGVWLGGRVLRVSEDAVPPGENAMLEDQAVTGEHRTQVCVRVVISRRQGGGKLPQKNRSEEDAAQVAALLAIIEQCWDDTNGLPLDGESGNTGVTDGVQVRDEGTEEVILTFIAEDGSKTVYSLCGSILENQTEHSSVVLTVAQLARLTRAIADLE